MHHVRSCPLVDCSWLHEHVDDPDVRIVDVRWYLSGRLGADAYTQGHIPGAFFVDLDRDLAAPKGAGPGRHPLPTATQFSLVLARMGIRADSTIVAYDDAGGAVAARMWWLLRRFGLGGGRVLDGGIDAYSVAGFPLTRQLPSAMPTEPLPLRPVADVRVVDSTYVDRVRGNPSVAVLDARATERYEGRVEPIDARPGHIPLARSAPFANNLMGPTGPLKPRRELEALYRELGALDAKEVIAYCGSGVTACHTLLSLAVVGRTDAVLYEGSWSDWASDPSLPAALGA